MRTIATPENIAAMAMRPLFKKILDGDGLEYIWKWRTALASRANMEYPSQALTHLGGYVRYNIEFGHRLYTPTDIGTNIGVVEEAPLNAVVVQVTSEPNLFGVSLEGLDKRVFPYFARSIVPTGTMSAFHPTWTVIHNSSGGQIYTYIPLIISLTDKLVDFQEVFRHWSATTRRTMYRYLISDVVRATSGEAVWSANPFLMDYYIRQADRITSIIPEIADVLKETSELNGKISVANKELAALVSERNEIIAQFTAS